MASKDPRREAKGDENNAGGCSGAESYGGKAGSGVGLSGLGAGSDVASGGATGAGLGSYGMTTDAHGAGSVVGGYGATSGSYAAHGSQEELIRKPGPGDEGQGLGRVQLHRFKKD